MGKPHIHASVIKAWADGAEVEVHYPQWPEYTWAPDRNPDWAECKKYRIKPKTIKYRNYLSCSGEICTIQDDERCPHGFVRWVGDWKEVEV